MERHPAIALFGVLFELGLRGLPVDVDSLTLVLFGDGFLDHRIEISQEVVVSDEEVGFAT